MEEDNDRVSIVAEDRRTQGLPAHVTAVMYAARSFHREELKPPEGCLRYTDIRACLDKEKLEPPWQEMTKSSQHLSFSRTDRELRDISSKIIVPSRSNLISKPLIADSSANLDFPADQKPKKTHAEKLQAFNKMVAQNPYNKIWFETQVYDSRVVPPYVVARLETACRSARYELPMDTKALEKLSNLEYISEYTRLYKEQRDRYAKIFKRFKQKAGDVLDYTNLYPALNSLYGGFLTRKNFEVLSVALFLDLQSSFDLNTFTAMCSLCDRFYWSAYLDGSNTFNYWAPNRSALEVMDFYNLKWKLHGLNIPQELQVLLFSLA